MFNVLSLHGRSTKKEEGLGGRLRDALIHHLAIHTGIRRRVEGD